ncbi:hypothetical protein IWQ61_004420 [Dispira simplex]|nr:hypothetical protein IWQ61_004420 [Dispira simplex]
MAPQKKQAKGGDGEQMVLNYLRKTNRPYSATDIFNNLHGALTKSAIQKALVQLHERSDIHGKTYGKQSVYVARQDDQEAPSTEELVEMDEQLESLKHELAGLKEETKELTTELSGLNSSLTNEQLEKRIAELTAENEEFEERLEVLRSGDNRMSAEDKERIDKAYDEYRKYWKKRKSMFKDIFDTITEHMPKKPREFMEEVGIETDEDAGVDIKVDPLANL